VVSLFGPTTILQVLNLSNAKYQTSPWSGVSYKTKTH
jgi:hypothetical protein